jgi:hypothetical protein
MEASLRVLGEDHPNMLSSMNNLASMYREQGRWKEAEELEVRVIETRKKVLGEDHPDTLTSMGNLAVTCMNQGRWEGGGRARRASDGDKKRGTGRGSASHADQHEKPSVGVHKSRLMEGRPKNYKCG